MRVAAFVISVIGFGLGLTSSYYETYGFYGSKVFGFPILTIAVCTLGLIGGALVLMNKKIGAWLCIAVAVGGIFTAFELWEAAGSFFLMSGLLGFLARQYANQAEESRPVV